MSKLFEGEAKGEVLQLRNQLDGNDPTIRKTAAKRTVALMRQGDNVACLFSSMLRCVNTDDIELKKLAYLYLTTYSSQEPEQAIMAVNTFVNDSQHTNPLIRALAVRTMCRIKLESVAEYMIAPTKRCLADPHPYVRKTAAFGVAKLYDVIPEVVENSGLLPELLKLIHDENPMVVSNTTASLFEINERRTSPIFTLDGTTVAPLLSAVSSCTEWCQTVLFDALARYVPESSEDATFLIDRLSQYLKHKNPAVVIGAFRCIFQYMEADSRSPVEIFPQVIPPFITLVTSAEPEVQYVVLRTLSLFVLKFPKALSKEIRVFFCKYNDPAYVKMEKLDIIVTICSPATAELVLDELSEYCNEVDVAFVRKSIRAIGQIAIKIEAAAKRCVDILVNLVKGKADYATEESVCVITDVLRKFPGTFESVIETVCSNLDSIKEPRAKTAAIWILGEYCRLIDQVDVLLDPFLDTFHDEQPMVQLQILSSLVKVFIEKPEETRDQLQFVLTEATKDTNVPDVRNRALVYWRLLSTDQNSARNIVCFDKQSVEHSGVKFDDGVLNELIKNMGTVSGILHVVASDFVRRARFHPEDDEEADIRQWSPVQVSNPDLVELKIDFSLNVLHVQITNRSPMVLTGLAFAMNKNAIGLTQCGQPKFPASIDYGATAVINVPTRIDPALAANREEKGLQMALKTSAGQVMALGRIPFELVTVQEGMMTRDQYTANFNAFPGSGAIRVPGARVADNGTLAMRNVFVVGSHESNTYVSFALPSGDIFVAELSQGANDLGVEVRANNPQLIPAILADSMALFATK